MNNQEKENIKNTMGDWGAQCITGNIFPVMLIGVTEDSGLKELRLWNPCNYPPEFIKEICRQIIEQL